MMAQHGPMGWQRLDGRGAAPRSSERGGRVPDQELVDPPERLVQPAEPGCRAAAASLGV
jgi:hypothetical protein